MRFQFIVPATLKVLKFPYYAEKVNKHGPKQVVITNSYRLAWFTKIFGNYNCYYIGNHPDDNECLLSINSVFSRRR